MIFDFTIGRNTNGFKSLLLDVDGTLVPVGPYKIPSDVVKEAVTLAKDRVSISIVSGRPLEWLTDIFDTLQLTHPCIINGGSQIIDPISRNILWEKPLESNDLKTVLRLIVDHNMQCIVNDSGKEFKNEPLRDFEKVLSVQMSYFDSKDSSDNFLDLLNSIPTLSAHKFYSWDSERSYKMEIYITHKEATKEHAVHELAQMLRIKKNHIIGIGDSRNDIPLLNACGLKIAMGNADEKLKKIAHYVAPSVDEDGVADAIKRFVLV